MTAEHRADFFRRGEADGVGQVDGGGAGGNSRLRSGSPARCGLHPRPRIRHRRWRASDYACVPIPVPARGSSAACVRGAAGWSTGTRAGAGWPRLPVHVPRSRYRPAARQHRQAQARSAQFAADQCHRLAVGLRAGREAGFDDVHTHSSSARAITSAAGSCCSRGLLAVTQGGVEDADARGGNFDGGHREISSTAGVAACRWEGEEVGRTALAWRASGCFAAPSPRFAAADVGEQAGQHAGICCRRTPPRTCGRRRGGRRQRAAPSAMCSSSASHQGFAQLGFAHDRPAARCTGGGSGSRGIFTRTPSASEATGDLSDIATDRARHRINAFYLCTNHAHAL